MNEYNHTDFECVICLDQLEEQHKIRLMCDHELHEDCLKLLLNENEICLCPICRKFIGMYNIPRDITNHQTSSVNSYKVRFMIICIYFCFAFCSFIYIQYMYLSNKLAND